MEVIDVDPASGAYYEPVNLKDPHFLAQDGLPASALNPQFHQQMVYAVVMTTVKNFERAIGRPVMWSDRTPWKKYKDMTAEDWQKICVQRLAIYPHALREANAYYSPTKKALLSTAQGFLSAVERPIDDDDASVCCAATVAPALAQTSGQFPVSTNAIEPENRRERTLRLETGLFD